MTNRQPDPTLSGREFDPSQVAPEQIQTLISNEHTRGQTILLRELHCVMRENAAMIPAFAEDDLIIQTNGHSVLRGRAGKLFQEKPHSAGDIAIIPKGIPSEWFMTGSYDLLQLLISPDFITTIALETLDTDPARVELRERLFFRDPLIYAIGLALRDDALAGGFAGTLYADSLAHTLAIHLLRQYAVFRLNPPKLTYDLSGSMLRRVIDYIQANLARDLSLAEIAGTVYLSPYHLTRLFKRATGQSLHQYVIAQRVDAAQRLITAGRLPLSAVASQVGFADQSHLTRHFKRLQGVSPTVFIKERKNIQEPRTNLQDSPAGPE